MRRRKGDAGRAYLGTVQLLCWKRRIGGKGRKERKKKQKRRLAFKVK